MHFPLPLLLLLIFQATELEKKDLRTDNSLPEKLTLTGTEENKRLDTIGIRLDHDCGDILLRGCELFVCYQLCNQVTGLLFQFEHDETKQGWTRDTEERRSMKIMLLLSFVLSLSSRAKERQRKKEKEKETCTNGISRRDRQRERKNEWEWISQ